MMIQRYAMSNPADIARGDGLGALYLPAPLRLPRPIRFHPHVSTSAAVPENANRFPGTAVAGRGDYFSAKLAIRRSPVNTRYTSWMPCAPATDAVAVV